MNEIELMEKEVTEALELWEALCRKRDADPELVALEVGRGKLLKALDEIAIQENEILAAHHNPAIGAAGVKLEDAVKRLGYSMAVPGAEALFTAGYTRVTYSSKDIDRVLAKNPAIAEIINPFRKEKDVAPRVKLQLVEEANDAED